MSITKTEPFGKVRLRVQAVRLSVQCVAYTLAIVQIAAMCGRPTRFNAIRYEKCAQHSERLCVSVGVCSMFFSQRKPAAMVRVRALWQRRVRNTLWCLQRNMRRMLKNRKETLKLTDTEPRCRDYRQRMRSPIARQQTKKQDEAKKKKKKTRCGRATRIRRNEMTENGMGTKSIHHLKVAIHPVFSRNQKTLFHFLHFHYVPVCCSPL